MYASNYFEQAILNLLRGNSITAPGTVYLGLFLTNPTDTGQAGNELSYSGYVRQPITLTAPAASEAGIYVENANEIGFAESAIAAGTINYAAIFDEQSGGNMLVYAQLSNPLEVVAGIAPVFRTSSIRWTFSGNISPAMKTAILNVLRGADVAGITPWIALCNGDILASGVEFSGNNYARFRVTFSAPAQQESGAAQVKNTALALSNIATGSWGNLTHIAIMSAQTEGTIFATMAVPNPFQIKNGMAAGFQAEALKLSMN